MSLPADSHAIAMLTYPDRQKFEQMRTRWETETAQPTTNQPSAMPGSKEKPVAHQASDAGASKFRRKLSHGLSFISNPLSQRKTTSGRLASAAAAVALNHNDNDAALSDRLLSPIRNSSSFDHRRHSPVSHTRQTDHTTINNSNNPDATSKPLPRSQTMTYIPRLTRIASEAPIVEPGTTPKPPSLQSTFAPQSSASPSKIPSPPATKRRLSSPRQYLPHHTTQQSKHIAAGMAFAPTPAGTQSSSSKASVRSYTTPNLMKRKTPLHPGSFIVPRKSALQRKHSGSPGVQQPSMKENHTPLGKRDSRRISHIQDVSLRRASLAVPAVAPKRSSLGLIGSPRQSIQAIRTTPPNAQRLSTSLATQTPMTARRMQPKKQPAFQASTPYRYSNGSSIAQPRLMGPVNPPTPQVVDQVTAQPALLRSSTDKDLRRQGVSRTSSEDKGKGVGMTSEAAVSGNTEVRQRLPHSRTFHNLWSHRDPPPPVPSVPAIYKSFSQPIFVVPEATTEEDNKPLSFISEEKPGNHGWGFRSVHSKSEVFVEPSSLLIVDLNDANLDNQAEPEIDPNWPLGPPVALATPSRSNGSWSIQDQHVESTNTNSQVQVKDYMPPLWWAGRFQARFDQWRTEAMMAELGPQYKPEGMPGRCSLSQEKVAACYIFLQLRNLCMSNQAADSLWDFEYKYRQDHKLLGDSINIPTFPKRKLDDTTTRASFGRAVRKLTPRKSSLVNLLKGKGWNKVEGITEVTTPSASSSGS